MNKMKWYRFPLLFVLVVVGILFVGCSGTASTSLSPTAVPQDSPTWVPPTEPSYSKTCTDLSNCSCNSGYTAFVTPGPVPCEQYIGKSMYYGYCSQDGYKTQFSPVGLVQDIHGSIPLNSKPSTLICVMSTPTPLFLPGAIVTPTPTLPVSNPDPSIFAVEEYCVDPNKQIGGATVYWTGKYWVSFESGPLYAQKSVTDLAELSKYFQGNTAATNFIGPAGAQFFVYQANTGNIDLIYQLSYGTCGVRKNNGGGIVGSGGSSGGGGSCSPPSGGCPSGSFWQGAPSCYCASMK